MEIQALSVVVTGGASGLGGATVRRLHSAGAKVVIADRNAEVGMALANELGSNAQFVACDVTDEASLAAALDQAIAINGRLQAVISCAGVGSAEKILGRNGVHSLESFNRVMQVNLNGVFNALRLGAERISQNEPNAAGERGVIINTASIAAFDGQIGQVAYSASKGAIVGLTLPAARELARHGIRVMTIAPGTFDTPLLAGLPEPARQTLAAQVPFPPRLGDPAEFAMLAQHILENPMLNGETIRLDGALRMGYK
ncbi:3-hydroxyacyl-CoA dehydrogenase [Herpetosiphon giganteus]|uniref:3-hydroxyacyl-CoA dehydrogenase n=1 Tax=Herpetosiphon giganteus TaxID=2029754 RepID=UPI0019594EA3|nr:3-hydroxyacyl-CoA dehydrogenase [Herpetosiphon giganteus]MBM7842206.1 NAD(P)-dependent dehydrogenase (short-subunit alcohol dehydrogenase family) [Herpetosiphon giganteus]